MKHEDKPFINWVHEDEDFECSSCGREGTTFIIHGGDPIQDFYVNFCNACGTFAYGEFYSLDGEEEREYAVQIKMGEEPKVWTGSLEK